MFGPHLMLDLYECNKEKLLDAKFVLNFLSELPAKLGMTKISGPHLIEYPENPKTWDKGGVSAIVIIAESHISIHTFPYPNGYMNFDVFSCKMFEMEKTIELVKEAFEAKKINKRLIMRGKHFPKEEILAMNAAKNQREEAIAKSGN